MREVVIPYSRRELRPVFICLIMAGIVAVITSSIVLTSAVGYWLSRVLPLMVRLVPSIATISGGTANPMISAIILAIQWLFAPVYVFLWFYLFPPWSRRMAQTISNAREKLPSGRRVVGMSIGIIFFSAWLLGDFGVIDFPTFYNGKYVYPLAGAVPQLKLVYGSSTLLAIYAWFGPFAEALILWMFFVTTLNANRYYASRDSIEGGNVM
jgi:hypothetical protein